MSKCVLRLFHLIFVSLQRQLFGLLFFSDIKLIYLDHLEWNAQFFNFMLINRPTKTIKKRFFDFIRQRTALLQSCVVSCGTTSEITVSPFAHHPFLSVIFRCWMGFIKWQCNTRGQLYFYHVAITFLSKA